jgi:phytol kinase
MFFGGWIFAISILYTYIKAGVFKGNISEYVIPITVIAIIGTIIESLPYKDVDNITVPISALITGYLTLPKI